MDYIGCWRFILVTIIYASTTVTGLSILPVYTIDKACFVGSDSMNVNVKKTFEMWSGSEIPISQLPGDTKLFTGFKFHRVFSFHQLFRGNGKALKITYCKEGKEVFQTEKEIAHDGDDWERPWCFFEDGNESVENIESFHCLKIARRKKYAIRPFDIFIPYTWIGGLFYCNISENEKISILTKQGKEEPFKPYSGSPICTLDNSIPIEPLYASLTTSSYNEIVSKKLVPFITLLSKRKTKTYIPYLQSPNLCSKDLNITSASFEESTKGPKSLNRGYKVDTKDLVLERYSFGQNNTNSNTRAKWFREIEVDEKYKYNREDHFMLTLATNKLRGIITPFVEPSAQDLEELSFPLKTINRIIETKIWKTFGITDKLLTLNLQDILDKCEAFLKFWDNMHLDDEEFTYKYSDIQK